MTGRARGPYAKTAERRAAILDAARASFAEHGYEAASLRDIAERAGMTTPGLLHHFPGKEPLLAALLAQRDTEEQQRAAAEVVDPLGDPASVASFLREMLREHQATPDLMRLWAELAIAASRAGHPAHGYFVDRYHVLRAIMTQQFSGGGFGGALRDGLDAETAAVLFIAVLDGLQTQWLLDPELDILEPLDSCLDLLVPERGPRPLDTSAGNVVPS